MNIQSNMSSGGVSHCQLGDVLEFRNEIVHPKDGPSGTATFVGLEHIERDTGVRIGSDQIDLAKMTGRRARFRAGDIVYGYLRPYLNKVWVAEFDGLCSVDQYVFKTNENVSRSYVAYFLRSIEFLKTAPIDSAPGQLPRIRSGEIAETLIPLPSLDEQRRIAVILDKADALRRDCKRVLTLLDRLTQSAFINIVEDRGSRSPRIRMTTIAQAGRVQLGRQRAPKYQSGAHSKPYLRVANVYEDYLNFDDVLCMDFDERDFREYRLLGGDILLNEGQSTELVGRPAMWRDEIEDCCFQNTLIRFQADGRDVLPEFALGVFLDYFRRGEFAKISSKTSSVAHLGAGRFAQMPFPIPPIEDQRNFTVVSRRSRENKRLWLAKLIAMKSLFASLQHRAFTGQL